MLNIVLTIDLDADVFDQSLQVDPFLNQQPGWKGLEEGVPLLSELFSSYKGSDGSACVATWFVRADDQVGHYYGSNAYLFTEYKNLWSPLLNAGHEIAWHPHLYKFDSNSWSQQTDAAALDQQMHASLKAIRAEGWKINSSRIGEAYFSNAIAACLQTLDIACDSTALPGRERKDETRSIDWMPTPETPFFPSQTDYRVPGMPQCSVLEIPFSMVPVSADYDAQPLKRYVDLSFWHRALKDGLHDFITDHRSLVTIVHPSAVIPGLAAKPHGLLSHSMEEVKKNLDFIVATAKQKNIDYCFKTIFQLHNQFLNER